MNDHILAWDDSIGLLTSGYAWAPSLLRRAGGEAVHTRLMGQPALVVRGPDAVQFFYDERHIRRHGAIPEPVQGTLFGKGAVHTLDGGDHRARKALFLRLLRDPRRVSAITDHVALAWDRAVPTWGDITLFDESARVLTRGMYDWTGVPLDEDETPAAARDLTAMVDGFATAGPRHWRARRARGRLERNLTALISVVRAGAYTPPPDSALKAVARHTGADGRLLDPSIAAVELLNIIRPTVAVSWFLAFAGHALHRWPEHRAPLRDGDREYAVAFAHELRRFYPFAPFVGGRAVADLSFQGERIRAGSLVLLDIYGQNHDEKLWDEPYRFRPERFLGRQPDPCELIPQGGADPADGHRCPGEDVTVALIALLATRLARLSHEVPPQDMSISLRRIPAIPRSRIRLHVTE